METKAKPNPVDVHLGGQIRLRRRLLGLSHDTLSTAADMTARRVQEIESGETRIESAELHRISEAMDVPISFFFDGMAASTGWWNFWGVERRRGIKRRQVIERRAGRERAARTRRSEQRRDGERRAGSERRMAA